MDTINEIIAGVEKPPTSFEEYLTCYADKVGALINEYIPRVPLSTTIYSS